MTTSVHTSSITDNWCCSENEETSSEYKKPLSEPVDSIRKIRFGYLELQLLGLPTLHPIWQSETLCSTYEPLDCPTQMSQSKHRVMCSHLIRKTHWASWAARRNTRRMPSAEAFNNLFCIQADANAFASDDADTGKWVLTDNSPLLPLSNLGVRVLSSWNLTASACVPLDA